MCVCKCVAVRVCMCVYVCARLRDFACASVHVFVPHPEEASESSE